MTGRPFLLDSAEGRGLSVDTHGTDKRIIVTGGRMPDGIVVDVQAGRRLLGRLARPGSAQSSALLAPREQRP